MPQEQTQEQAERNFFSTLDTPETEQVFEMVSKALEGVRSSQPQFYNDWRTAFLQVDELDQLEGMAAAQAQGLTGLEYGRFVEGYNKNKHAALMQYIDSLNAVMAEDAGLQGHAQALIKYVVPRAIRGERKSIQTAAGPVASPAEERAYEGTPKGSVYQTPDRTEWRRIISDAEAVSKAKQRGLQAQVQAGDLTPAQQSKIQQEITDGEAGLAQLRGMYEMDLKGANFLEEGGMPAPLKIMLGRYDYEGIVDHLVTAVYAGEKGFANSLGHLLGIVPASYGETVESAEVKQAREGIGGAFKEAAGKQAQQAGLLNPGGYVRAAGLETAGTVVEEGIFGPVASGLQRMQGGIEDFLGSGGGLAPGAVDRTSAQLGSTALFNATPELVGSFGPYAAVGPAMGAVDKAVAGSTKLQAAGTGLRGLAMKGASKEAQKKAMGEGGTLAAGLRVEAEKRGVRTAEQIYGKGFDPRRLWPNILSKGGLLREAISIADRLPFYAKHALLPAMAFHTGSSLLTGGMQGAEKGVEEFTTLGVKKPRFNLEQYEPGTEGWLQMAQDLNPLTGEGAAGHAAMFTGLGWNRRRKQTKAKKKADEISAGDEARAGREAETQQKADREKYGLPDHSLRRSLAHRAVEVGVDPAVFEPFVATGKVSPALEAALRLQDLGREELLLYKLTNDPKMRAAAIKNEGREDVDPVTALHYDALAGKAMAIEASLREGKANLQKALESETIEGLDIRGATPAAIQELVRIRNEHRTEPMGRTATRMLLQVRDSVIKKAEAAAEGKAVTDASDPRLPQIAWPADAVKKDVKKVTDGIAKYMDKQKVADFNDLSAAQLDTLITQLEKGGRAGPGLKKVKDATINQLKQVLTNKVNVESTGTGAGGKPSKGKGKGKGKKASVVGESQGKQDKAEPASPIKDEAVSAESEASLRPVALSMPELSQAMQRLNTIEGEVAARPGGPTARARAMVEELTGMTDAELAAVRAEPARQAEQVELTPKQRAAQAQHRRVTEFVADPTESSRGDFEFWVRHPDTTMEGLRATRDQLEMQIRLSEPREQGDMQEGVKVPVGFEKLGHDASPAAGQSLEFRTVKEGALEYRKGVKYTDVELQAKLEAQRTREAEMLAPFFADAPMKGERFVRDLPDLAMEVFKKYGDEGRALAARIMERYEAEVRRAEFHARYSKQESRTFDVRSAADLAPPDATRPVRTGRQEYSFPVRQSAEFLTEAHDRLNWVRNELFRDEWVQGNFEPTVKVEPHGYRSKGKDKVSAGMSLITMPGGVLVLKDGTRFHIPKDFDIAKGYNKTLDGYVIEGENVIPVDLVSHIEQSFGNLGLERTQALWLIDRALAQEGTSSMTELQATEISAELVKMDNAQLAALAAYARPRDKKAVWSELARDAGKLTERGRQLPWHKRIMGASDKPLQGKEAYGLQQLIYAVMGGRAGGEVAGGKVRPLLETLEAKGEVKHKHITPTERGRRRFRSEDQPILDPPKTKPRAKERNNAELFGGVSGGKAHKGVVIKSWNMVKDAYAQAHKASEKKGLLVGGSADPRVTKQSRKLMQRAFELLNTLNDADLAKLDRSNANYNTFGEKHLASQTFSDAHWDAVMQFHAMIEFVKRARTEKWDDAYREVYSRIDVHAMSQRYQGEMPGERVGADPLTEASDPDAMSYTNWKAEAAESVAAQLYDTSTEAVSKRLADAADALEKQGRGGRTINDTLNNLEYALERAAEDPELFHRNQVTGEIIDVDILNPLAYVKKHMTEGELAPEQARILEYMVRRIRSKIERAGHEVPDKLNARYSQVGYGHTVNQRTRVQEYLQEARPVETRTPEALRQEQTRLKKKMDSLLAAGETVQSSDVFQHAREKYDAAEESLRQRERQDRTDMGITSPENVLAGRRQAQTRAMSRLYSRLLKDATREGAENPAALLGVAESLLKTADWNIAVDKTLGLFRARGKREGQVYRRGEVQEQDIPLGQKKKGKEKEIVTLAAELEGALVVAKEAYGAKWEQIVAQDRLGVLDAIVVHATKPGLESARQLRESVQQVAADQVEATGQAWESLKSSASPNARLADNIVDIGQLPQGVVALVQRASGKTESLSSDALLKLVAQLEQGTVSDGVQYLRVNQDFWSEFASKAVGEEGAARGEYNRVRDVLNLGKAERTWHEKLMLLIEQQVAKMDAEDFIADGE